MKLCFYRAWLTHSGFGDNKNKVNPFSEDLIAFIPYLQQFYEVQLFEEIGSDELIVNLLLKFREEAHSDLLKTEQIRTTRSIEGDTKSSTYRFFVNQPKLIFNELKINKVLGENLVERKTRFDQINENKAFMNTNRRIRDVNLARDSLELLKREIEKQKCELLTVNMYSIQAIENCINAGFVTAISHVYNSKLNAYEERCLQVFKRYRAYCSLLLIECELLHGELTMEMITHHVLPLSRFLTELRKLLQNRLTFSDLVSQQHNSSEDWEDSRADLRLYRKLHHNQGTTKQNDKVYTYYVQCLWFDDRDNAVFQFLHQSLKNVTFKMPWKKNNRRLQWRDKFLFYFACEVVENDSTSNHLSKFVIWYQFISHNWIITSGTNIVYFSEKNLRGSFYLKGIPELHSLKQYFELQTKKALKTVTFKGCYSQFCDKSTRNSRTIKFLLSFTRNREFPVQVSRFHEKKGKYA